MLELMLYYFIIAPQLESRYNDDFIAVQELLFWQMGSR